MLRLGLPWWLRQSRMVRSLGQEDALVKGRAAHSSTLAGKSHGQRGLAGYSARSRKASDTTEQLTHSVKTRVYTRFLIDCHLFQL